MPMELKFKCKAEEDDFLIVESSIEHKEVIIKVFSEGDIFNSYLLDIPTAIKLSKTIRTHINEVKKSQGVNNG